MRDRSRSVWPHAFVWVAGFIVTTSVLVVLARATITWPKPCPGFVCYWSAATLLAHGQNPYDLALLSRIQKENGWDKLTDGFGFFDFLPNYHPPSLLGLVCVALVPLGFSTARMTWLVVNAELLVVAGYMLRTLVPSVSGRVPMVLVPVFCLSVLSVLVGQVAALILFLIVVVWRLLQDRSDRSAGWVLAWMTIKPQLTALFLMASLLWSIRQRRWQVIEGFVTGAAALLLLSTWLVPSWPTEIVKVMRETSLVTTVFPWLGTTWLLVLRSLGLEGWILWALYAAIALPFLVLVLHYALRRDSSLADVLAVSLLAAFFVSPTARPYDQPILLITLLVIVARRASDLVAGALVFAFIVAPYVHFFLVPVRSGLPNHVWFFWIPLTLALSWFLPRFPPRDPRRMPAQAAVHASAANVAARPTWQSG